MCGITGLIKYYDKVSDKDILAMNKEITHRGPDDFGYYTTDCHNYSIGIGHVRLSIIDLSERGHQPMGLSYNHLDSSWTTIYKDTGLENADLIVTYNGEIYNFKELKVMLEEAGHKFISHCDTEVLIRGFVQWGMEKLLSLMDGMFAFVIWDKRINKLFGARDRLGKKPLKYYMDKDCFIFASELKAILTQPIKREVDLDAVDDYLSLQFVPAPKTGFKNIYKLPHGHYFTYDIQAKRLSIEKYWEINYKDKLKMPKKEIAEVLEKYIDDAVKKRMIADVEIGAFLSGGLDSSAIVAFATRYKERLKTFTIKFDEKKYDESSYAKIIAERFCTEHHEFLVKPESMVNLLDKLAFQYEEPFADVSALPTYILSERTADYVKVILNGDGGDENFAGYDRYKSHRLAKLSRFIPFKGFFAWLFRIAAEKTYSLRLYAGFIFFKTMMHSDNIRHYNYTYYFDVFTKDKFYRPEIKKQIPEDYYRTFRVFETGFSTLDNIMSLDFNTYLPDGLMVKVDIATMAYGIESRSPFLDYKLVEFAAKIPEKYKIRRNKRKIILKDIFSKYIDKDIINRKKAGFDVPVDDWFRGELKDFIKELLLDENGLTLKIFKKVMVEKLLGDHYKGMNNGKKLLVLVNLNLWYRKFFIEKKAK